MEHGHGFIAWILIGIAVGWFANRAAESRAYGRLTDLISSLVGAMIGGFLTTHFGFGAVSGVGFGISLLMAVFGAVALTFLVRMIGTATHSADS